MHKKTGLIFPILSLTIGASISVLGMYSWYVGQYEISIYLHDKIPDLTFQLYALQFISLILILLGSILFLRYIRTADWKTGTIKWIISEALRNKRSIRYGLLGGFAYLILYMFISGFIVFRPWIDYTEILGIKGPSIFFTGCCGEFGAIPRVVIYLVPELGLGLLLIPLNLLFTFLLPILVGINLVITHYSIKVVKGTGSSTNLLAKVGLITGVFTACPTCAGIIIYSFAASLGSLAVATVFVMLQKIFILVTIPILILSPILTSYILSKNIYCKL